VFCDGLNGWHGRAWGSKNGVARHDDVERSNRVGNAQGRFVWYELTTTDMAAARTFYAAVLGWRAHDVSMPGMDYALFVAGKATVAGVMGLPADAAQMGAQPRWMGYVGVDDVDATAERVRQLGGTVHVPPEDIPDISRFSVVADPQSAMFALFKGAKPGQQPPAGKLGRVSWHELLAADGETAFAFYGALFGWQKADADTGPNGTYQTFSAGGQTIGGLFTKPPMVPDTFWLYYFDVGDIDAAAARVRAGGGRILEGPIEVAGGRWILRCTDPQGAMFGLEGKRNRQAVGYFESAPNPSGARGRRWHW
jgi:predicted enzyme related to lactoylglutathione lyase